MEGAIRMEFIFIRHGRSEHLVDYPHRLNTLHPGLTDEGKDQAARLKEQLRIDPNDAMLVSPTKRTTETALILRENSNFIVTPLVGPRMFPLDPGLPALTCDRILSRSEI